MHGLEEIIGRVIRRARKERHLTIKELAIRADLSVAYVGEVERGLKYPSAKALLGFAQSLNIDIADLLEIIAQEMRSECKPHAMVTIGSTSPFRSSHRIHDRFSRGAVPEDPKLR